LKALSENFRPGKIEDRISLNDTPSDESLSAYIDEYRPILKSVATTGRFLPQ